MTEPKSVQAIGLKEWAAALEALRQGEQILIMRKGGIREETRDFQVEADSFYLYPTFEHQRKELIKPEYQAAVDRSTEGWSPDQTQVELTCYAELVEDILIEDGETLAKLAGEHIWTDRFAEERLKWKKTKPLHVMLLRVYELENPATIEIREEYNGCKSWISLPGEMLQNVPRKPVLSDEEFSRKVERLRSLLQ
ncbi:DUF1802 family protein [Paenibacillus caseinilyticus]|uniref:DUF1802 domain-containing protein n=1 Tax=Paenibacillus mucilaginosus K02 TaxID=997761 RepID=I0BDT0_9BACL|nr:DUF1802 family protein [Paenibacillus mucilaginosus]AFH60527.1 hypothetical protein B2K_07305 [Paenibacillus mucilaginosus K02]